MCANYPASTASRAISHPSLRCLNALVSSEWSVDSAKADGQPKKGGDLKLTFTAKDCFNTADVATTCGSRILENYVPTYSATVVNRLSAGGFRLVGKANMDEFAMGSRGVNSYFGRVANPWSLKSKKWNAARGSIPPRQYIDRDWIISGGSSSGSGASVAAGLADISLGSDTGGSTLNPSAHCGVIGFKPTYGVLSRHGLIPLVNSLDCPALVSRSVERLFEAFVTCAGRDPADPTSVDLSVPTRIPRLSSIEGLTVGLPAELLNRDLHPDVVDALDSLSEHFRGAGAVLKPIALPHVQHSLSCYHILGFCEIASNLARYDGVEFGHRTADPCASFTEMLLKTRQEGLGNLVRKRVIAGNYFLLEKNYSRYFVQALKVRRLIAEEFWRAFRQQEGVDVLLAPVTHAPPPLASESGVDQEEWYEDDFLTQGNNMAGVPAISLPVAISSDNTPIGLQLIADCYEDVELLSLAHWLERTFTFPPITETDVGSFEKLIDS